MTFLFIPALFLKSIFLNFHLAFKMAQDSAETAFSRVPLQTE